MSLGIISLTKIFLTVLFHTLTNNVSFVFLFLIKHFFLYHCYCTSINLYVGFQFFYVYIFLRVASGSLIPHIDRQKLFLKL
jgi:hypothetical protein